MKKVGIITLQGLFNYGNRLQNYAVQQVIEQYGYEAESVVLTGSIRDRVKNIVIFFAEARVTNKLHYIARFFNSWRFNRKNIRIKKFKENHLTADIISNRYDFLALGGDQIWNQRYSIFGSLDSAGFQFGSAVSAERRIPFSPSFGETIIPENRIEYCRHWLNEIPYLAIREQSGANIIYDLTRKKAEVVIDPVMLLSERDWIKVFNPNKFRHQKYVLTCFLGGTNEERNEIVQSVAKGRLIKGVGRYEDNYAWCGPDDYLSLVYNADVICTDSFHCAAFAILFKKPFIVFDRLNIDHSQMTRLWNLLEVFQLLDRHESVVDFQNCELIDFHHTDCILEAERFRYRNFLSHWFDDTPRG